MSYYIDLNKISLDEYEAKLAAAYLPPSRMILKEGIAKHFLYLKNTGITNVDELLKLLKKKGNIEDISAKGEIPEEYLKVLMREIKSIQPKPNKLSEFFIVSKEAITALEELGIKNTEKLYPKVINNQNRTELAKQTGISVDEIVKLTKLTDLSRLKWVGSTYAQILFEAGLHSVEMVAKANVEELHLKINQIIKEKSVFKGSIGLNDVHILIEIAKELPQEISY